ncbi:MAG: homocysteine S-methyltransferase family protein [bacterium]|nr:homocysteine S-methyltransferase family protein [bacterium]
MRGEDNKNISAALAAGQMLAPASGQILVLDGATGTELERRGAPCGLPLWSSGGLLHTPELVGEIHADYARAGCDLLTAASFRTQRRTLTRCGMGERAPELTRLAVALARQVHRGPVLGSAPPLEDCYRPERVPDQETLESEHCEHADLLAAAGADAILAETHNTAREAKAAAQAARAAGLPILVSFVCNERGRLLSGEALETGIDSVLAVGPVAVGVNCLPISALAECIPVLAASGLPFLLSPNMGTPSERVESLPPDQFAALTQTWREAGASIIGGCCGTTPEHLAAVVRLQRSA